MVKYAPPTGPMVRRLLSPPRLTSLSISPPQIPTAFQTIRQMDILNAPGLTENES